MGGTQRVRPPRQLPRRPPLLPQPPRVQLLQKDRRNRKLRRGQHGQEDQQGGSGPGLQPPLLPADRQPPPQGTRKRSCEAHPHNPRVKVGRVRAGTPRSQYGVRRGQDLHSGRAGGMEPDLPLRPPHEGQTPQLRKVLEDFRNRVRWRAVHVQRYAQTSQEIRHGPGQESDRVDS